MSARKPSSATPSAQRQWPIGLFVGPLVVAADLFTKSMIEEYLEHLTGQRRPLAGGLDLVLSYKEGVTRAAPQQAPTWAVVAGAMLVTMAVAACLFQTRRVLAGVAYGLLLGGLIGNILDRLDNGTIVDFLRFGAAAQGPTLNFADFSIGLGVALWAYDAWRSGRRKGLRPGA